MQELWLGPKKLNFVRYVLVAYLFFFYSFPLISFSTLEELDRIPEQDRKDLEELFSYFVQRTTFAYTLFGEKPVSWFLISIPEFPKIKCSKKIVHRQAGKIPLWSRWQTWKRHENKFPLKNYVFISEFDPKLPFNICSFPPSRRSLFTIVTRQIYPFI